MKSESDHIDYFFDHIRSEQRADASSPMVTSKFCMSSFDEETLRTMERIYYSHCYTRKELRSFINKITIDDDGDDGDVEKTMSFDPFTMDSEFLVPYKKKKPEFGFNGLGEATYHRTYSRLVEDDERGTMTKETWFDTVKRVVEGTMNTMKRHVIANGIHWSDVKAQKTSQVFFDLIFNMKFLPPGRGLWAMGTPITESVGYYMALNNCAFISTQSIIEKGATIFAWLMDLSMMGCGVGFDTRGAYCPADGIGKRIYAPDKKRTATFVIGDTREGWVASTACLLNSYFERDQRHILFDYSRIRGKGARLRTFGGIAPGPEPLKQLHEQIRNIFDSKLMKYYCINGSSSDDDDDNGEAYKEEKGKKTSDGMGEACLYLTVTDIVDICNLIGVCVVSGNVRRTAEIAFGPHDSQEFIELKDYVKNPERCAYGWTSNNSIFAQLGMDYSLVAENIYKNGEPGLMWLDNARNNGRMSGTLYDRSRKDLNAMGGNPCLEQTLEDGEICNVVEIFMNKINSITEAKIVAKYAFLYAKIVSLGTVHWKNTDAIVKKNRRLGVSMTGIFQFIAKHGKKTFTKLCKQCYSHIQENDALYSSYFRVPRSIKTTSVKPSGTVALLGGASPGVHAHIFRQYIRRLTVQKGSDLDIAARASGYNVVDSPYGRDSCLIEFPIRIEENCKSERELEMREMLDVVCLLQRVWADNQVSATVKFDPEKVSKDDIADALDIYQYCLKGISFLPLGPIGQYKLPPYEPISDEKYQEMASKLKPINFNMMIPRDAERPQGCGNDTCEI